MDNTSVGHCSFSLIRLISTQGHNVSWNRLGTWCELERTGDVMWVGTDWGRDVSWNGLGTSCELEWTGDVMWVGTDWGRHVSWNGRDVSWNRLGTWCELEETGDVMSSTGTPVGITSTNTTNHLHHLPLLPTNPRTDFQKTMSNFCFVLFCLLFNIWIFTSSEVWYHY